MAPQLDFNLLMAHELRAGTRGTHESCEMGQRADSGVIS